MSNVPPRITYTPAQKRARVILGLATMVSVITPITFLIMLIVCVVADSERHGT